ncbi:hypothetical protein GQR58_024815 [Nymphon striatum]|nr:hypothetical protein GQR58_024815 [Nymphon striatum]
MEKKMRENFTSGKIRRVALKDLSDDGYNSKLRTNKENVHEIIVNPFSEQRDLISITSGLAATPTIRDHLLNAITYGQDAMELFRSERLGADSIKEFFDPLKRQNLQTFSTLRPKKVLKVNQKEVVLKADRELFGRMAVIGQSRDIDLKEVFSFPLGPIPWSLGDEFGMLRKTNKAAITTALEKNIEYVESVPQNSATLLDGMAVVQKLKIDQSNTFGDIAQKFSASISQAGFASKRIDVVFDVYIENSIKNAERVRRGTSSLQFGTLLDNSKVKQWKNFLSSSTGNKSRIISIDDVSSQANIQANKLGVSNGEYKRSLLGVYCFTGCDTVSAFAGKGKLKALKLLQEEREFVAAFSRLGLSWDVDNNLVNELQKFVCRLYGQKQSTVNELRYKMYCSKNGKVKSEQLPPCHNALKQHILRCNYQARIWRLAFENNPVYPEIHDHGWYLENQAIKIRWMTCQPAPNEVLSLRSCSCKRTCQPTKCSCIDNRMHCTDLCSCGECQNKFLATTESSDSGGESDSDFEDIDLVGKRFTEEILNDAIKQTSTNIQKQVERRELELTAEQKDCLECIHPTMVIYGLAGSGKTQILLMKVQRILDHDDLIGKTLIICYNFWLCEYIESQVDSEYVDVYNIFTQYSSFIKHESKCNCQKKFFGRHFIGDVDPDCLVLKKRYRHIFVDEAEDINFGAFQILDLIQDQPKNKEINFRWFFADPNQNFEDISTTYDQIEKKHYFSKIVRTTSNVFDIVSKNVLFANWPKDKSVRLDHGIAGPSIEWIELKYIGGEHIAEKIYSKCLVPLFIERKLKIKLKTYGNVVILVGCNEPYVYMEFRNKLKNLCRGKVNVKNRHPFRDDELPTVRIATVSEFKGFEADVVIVILDCYCLVQSSFLYTAASRCSCQLFVITTSDIMGKVNGPSVSPNHRNLSRKIFKDLMVQFNGHPLKVLVCEAFNTVVGSCENELKEICICTGRIKTITDSKDGHTCDEDYKMFLENRVYPFINLLGMDQPDENVFKDLQKHFLNLLQGNNFDSKSCNEERKLKPVKKHDQKEEKAIEKIRYWHRIMDFNKVVPSNLMAISVTLEQVECAESILNQLVINSPSQQDLDLVLYMKLFQLIKLDHFFGEILIFHDNKNNKTIMFHQALLQWKSYIGYIDIENFPNKVFAAVVRDDETVEYYEQRQKKVYKFRHIFMFDSENLEKHWNQLFDKIQTNSTTENRLWIFKNTEQSKNKDQPCFYNNFTIKNLNGYRRASRTQPKSTTFDNPCVHKHSSDNEVYGDHYLNYRQRRKLNENNLLPLY